MSFGETLRQYVREPRTQKSIALTWFEEMRKLGKEWSPSHVESQLSRCFKEQLPAIRFFFGDRGGGRALLKALAVPDADLDRILQVADETLAANGSRTARLVVDLTAWSVSIESKKLFEAVRVAIIEPQPLKPAVLLVTRSQYDELPRSFDRESEWLEVRCIDGTYDVEQVDANALIASPNPPKDTGRWLAIAFKGPAGPLAIEPIDGFIRFAQYGNLRLPEVASSLADFVDATTLPPPRVPKGPLERRRWMDQLSTEAEANGVDPDPRMRLAIARSLGIITVATEQDRTEHELAMAASRLAVPSPTVGTAAELDALLSRARRYPLEETVLRVGNELHVVNPKPDRDLEDIRVRVHRVESATPAIRQLQLAVASWTTGDYESDPFLLGLIEKLGATADEHLALLHARATLVRTGGLVPSAAATVDDWRSVLREALDRDPPQALLRISSPGCVLSSPLPSWVAPALERLNKADADVLRFTASPVGGAVVDRDHAWAFAYEESGGYGRSYERTNFELVSPRTVGDRSQIDDRMWIDAFDAFPRQSTYGAGVLPITLKPFELPVELWHEADEQMAILWLSLRRSVAAAAVRKVDGTVIVHLGRGLGMSIRATKTVRSLESAAILSTHGKGRLEVLDQLDTGIRGYREISVAVPRGLTLQHGSSRLEISFIASPLLGLAVSPGVDDGSDDESYDDD